MMSLVKKQINYNYYNNGQLLQVLMNAVVRDGIFVADDFDMPEVQRFEERVYDLVVRKRLVG